MTRRKLALGAAALMMLVAGPAVSAQTADEIVEKNLQAKGGLTRMRAIQSVRQTSRMSMQGMDGQIVMVSKRPNLMRQEMTIQGQTVIMANDGVNPWMINPFSGQSRAIILDGPLAEMTREQSAFDGPLVDYKERGSRLELVATEALGTAKVHHLKLTSKAGIVQHIYIDTTTMLDTLIVSETAGAGKLEQELLDYRDVEGIKVPFHVRTKTNGVVQSELKVEKVEFNAKIDDSVFKMPK